MHAHRADLETPEPVAGTTPIGPFEVRWVEHGPQDGPLVLLLHGVYAGARGYEWREITPLLAKAHRVRVPDLLGFGTSDRPDLEWTPDVLTRVVAALIDDARNVDAEAIVVASSLTAAHAVRAERGRPASHLVLITPTGLGQTLNGTSGTFGRLLYDLGRHTPVGDLFVYALSSAPSIRWFQRNQTYNDPEVLTEDEVVRTRATARLPNGKHAQLAFVTNRLGLALDPVEVEALAPRVLWGSGQRFVDPSDPDRWRAAGATVTVVDDGLPQVEHPATAVAFILGDD